MDDSAEVRFDRGLYRGTAAFYDAFRPAYPTEVLGALCARVPLGPDSRLVDLACGTGQIAFGLAPLVQEVVAVDQEPQFTGFGRAKASRLGIGNISWVTSAAEELSLNGQFDTVAIGNAFHRLKRSDTIDRVAPSLAVGGCVALLWSWSPWTGERQWQQRLAELMERWQHRVDERGRVPSGWERAIETTPHSQILIDAGLDYEGVMEFPISETWTTDTLIGNIYSSSHLNQRVLGSRSVDFEKELRTVLLADTESDEFTREQTYAVEIARRVG